MEGPDGAWAVVMQTVWDTEADAQEFEKAATTALEKAGGVGQVLPGAGGDDPLGPDRERCGSAAKVAGALGLAG